MKAHNFVTFDLALVKTCDVLLLPSVQEGFGLVVLEAMKMEHRIRAHGDGVIATIDIVAGDLVSEGQVLVALEGGASNE